MTASQPPAGFYDDPQDPARDRWWDGTQWTDVTREAEAERPGPLDAGGIVDALPGQLKGLYARHADDAQAAAGAALAADGVIGFGERRQGIGGAFTGILLGLAFVGAGWFVMQAVDASAVREPVGATATVVALDVETNRDSDGRTSTTCTPTVAFTTADGREVTAEPSATSGSMCSLEEGQQVEIVYDAQDPTRIAGLDELADRLGPLLPWLFIVIGGLVALSSLWTFLLRATQIGAGIALIARSRARSRDRARAKAEAKAAKAPSP